MAQNELQNRIEDLKVALAEAMNRLHSASGSAASAIEFSFDTQNAVNDIAKIRANPFIIGTGGFLVDNVNNRIEILQEGYYEFTIQFSFRSSSATNAIANFKTPKGINRVGLSGNTRRDGFSRLFKVDFTNAPNNKYVLLENITTFEQMQFNVIIKKLS